MNIKKPSLLDLFCENIGCSYVSDLRDEKMRSAVANATKSIINDGFSDCEWISAADYISQGKQNFTCAKAAKDYLTMLK